MEVDALRKELAKMQETAKKAAKKGSAKQIVEAPPVDVSR
jgi:hypothetical protein